MVNLLPLNIFGVCCNSLFFTNVKLTVSVKCKKSLFYCFDDGCWFKCFAKCQTLVLFGFNWSMSSFEEIICKTKNKKQKTNQKPNTVLITKCSKVIQLPCTLLMMQSKPRVSPQKTSAWHWWLEGHKVRATWFNHCITFSCILIKHPR